ncbi:TPA: DUF1700 domain-containing protein [Streptococcus pyogenes]|uniref:DUF1700 domain-containing protein n=1 Tax=Streptococcus pyogenes TaxID=1314 RepID=UPI0010A11260|nr:DUF1700 domain-containing protein [Streptococcus pyogenes]VHG13987.1 hypothetical membrane associated protein [Streptococcus pyogenes]HER6418063.1 DUF1700 domain-containing protein [Streptococcus pyogenes]HER6419585.1 DUF1700 domain-containing protein [Streptococcus pyogenes]HER6421072.1 DUF1700 domain-containing protein [Streptococcus pyogenes]HER6424427.1 DUF1700 domain-containing protein [Streptococcus pyogenes]
MTRTEYLAELDKYLRKLPREDYHEALEYYIEYFDEAGPDKESQVIDDLGNPKEAASEIISNVLGKHLATPEKTPKNRATIIGLTILSLFAAPIALPVLLALILFIIACLMLGLTAIFAAYIFGLAGILVSGVTLFESLTLIGSSIPAQAMGIGSALLCFGGGLLIWIIATAILRFSGRAFVAFIKWISNKKGAQA